MKSAAEKAQIGQNLKQWIRRKSQTVTETFPRFGKPPETSWNRKSNQPNGWIDQSNQCKIMWIGWNPRIKSGNLLIW